MLKNVKSKYIIQIFFTFLDEKNKLKLVKYNIIKYIIIRLKFNFYFKLITIY